MALETRPFPVLKGRDAREFWKKVDNFKITETREEIREINRWVSKMIDDARQNGRM